MSRRWLAVAAVSIVAGGLSGCGDGGEDETGPTGTSPPELTAAEKRAISRYEAAIGRYCRRFTRSVLQGQGPPPVAAQRRAMTAVESLIALARRKPDAVYRGGGDLRLLLGDVAENLQGSNCDSRLIDRLDQALAELPRSGP